ncbi:MAG: tetratricopeptide repeat protein [Spirochaetota bacterium]
MITLAVVLFVIVIVLGLGVYRMAQKKNRLDHARDLLEQEEYEKALGQFKELAAREPTRPLYHYYLALCYEKMQQYELALVELNKVALSTTFEPPLEEPEVHFRIARLHLTLGNERQAAQEFSTAATLDPQNADAHYYLGIIARNAEELQKSLEHFSNAVTHRQEFPRAHLELGKASYRLTHFERARKALQKALSQDPSLSEAHFYYGLLLEKDRSFAKAIEELQRSMQDERFAFPAAAHLASVYLELGDTEQAFKYFDQALETGTEDQPSLLEVKYRYANRLVDAGELHRALALWEEIRAAQAGFKDVEEKLRIYGRISTSDNLTRLVTAGKSEFVETGRELCRQLHVRVEKQNLGKENFVEYLGNFTSGISDRPCMVHFARWTVQVGEIPVRELLERMAEENAGKGYFITTSGFTEKALSLARIRPIELIDRDRLEQMLQAVYG